MAESAAESYVNAEKVAGLLGVSTNAVYDRAGREDLPSYRFGRSRRLISEVVAWAEAHRVGGAA